MLNDVQSGERSGLFAICNYSVSLATDPWFLPYTSLTMEAGGTWDQ